ncbi:MAG: hypothetical protein KF812_04485 [Fimbriimonadaceae bacterium]|nr:hypothetical protein [Fimbriimonadaceae bacterium]
MSTQIARRDRQVFARELVTFNSFVGYFLSIGIGVAVAAIAESFIPGALLTGVGFGLVAIAAYRKSVLKRFRNPRFLSLWTGCQERIRRFNSSTKELGRAGVAELTELPVTINKLADDLYQALRRADDVETEVGRSEGWLASQMRHGLVAPRDPQAQELYRVADQNIAEYKRHLESVMAGVKRAEAQAAVFMTTLDTLRIRMLGHRFGGREVEAESQAFLEAVTEAKMQLDAIDQALDEIALTPFPEKISVIPPRPDRVGDEFNREAVARSSPPDIPDEVKRRLNGQ